MTNDEFQIFAKRLFVSFPSLHEWLRGTLDPQATQSIWRETLRQYRLDECLLVIEAWNNGELKPFEAYERDKIHLIVRSMVGLRRDRERKRREAAERASDSNQKYERLPNTPYTDSVMSEVFNTLRPLHKKVLEGELSLSEYEAIHDKEFARL